MKESIITVLSVLLSLCLIALVFKMNTLLLICAIAFLVVAIIAVAVIPPLLNYVRSNGAAVVIVVFVVLVTVLLFVGKRGSKPKNSDDPSKQNVSGSTAPSGSDPAIGSVAPEFSLKSVPDGKTVTLSSLRGKAVVVNFWATWCGPCKIEMPWLVDLQKKYGDQGLQIVGITKDDSNEATIAKFTQKMGVNYTILVGNQQVQDSYGGVGGLPTSFFVDRSGKVVHEIVGLDSESKFEDAIKKALSGA